MHARTTGNFDPLMFKDPLVREADTWDTQIFRQTKVHPGLRRAYQNLRDQARVQIKTAAMDRRRALWKLPIPEKQHPEESVQPKAPLPVGNAASSGVASSSAESESFRKSSPLRILTQQLTETEHLICYLFTLIWTAESKLRSKPTCQKQGLLRKSSSRSTMP